MKTCTVCKKVKEVSEFGKRVASKDGLVASCLECQRERDKKRNMNPDRVLARRIYGQTSEGKAARIKARETWKQNNVIKQAASTIINRAVLRNKIIKPDNCSECGKGGRIHGHHDDYAYPMQVRWLCPKCHSHWHKHNEVKNG